METSTRPTFLNFKSKWFNYRAKVNENFARDIAIESFSHIGSDELTKLGHLLKDSVDIVNRYNKIKTSPTVFGSGLDAKILKQTYQAFQKESEHAHNESGSASVKKFLRDLRKDVNTKVKVI